jgi:hypothetical protein
VGWRWEHRRGVSTGRWCRNLSGFGGGRGSSWGWCLGVALRPGGGVLRRTAAARAFFRQKGVAACSGSSGGGNLRLCFANGAPPAAHLIGTTGVYEPAGGRSSLDKGMCLKFTNLNFLPSQPEPSSCLSYPPPTSSWPWTPWTSL